MMNNVPVSIFKMLQIGCLLKDKEFYPTALQGTVAREIVQ
jgi:hypothetical protein